jgi:hypothetical protein
MALCDLGASVSVMPRDVFEKLRLSELEPTAMCLELGDNSIRYPLGIAMDLLVKVGHHFIPVDFVVLDMGEREKPPFILGRPFLKTVGATIDVGKGEIKFDINGERSSFKFQPRFEVRNMIKVKYIPCNTPCFCLVSTSANDRFNQVPNQSWSTLGQTLAQNPRQTLDLPCTSRTFVVFSKFHLNTSFSPNVKVVQFIEAHNFYVEWHCQFARENGEKWESMPVSIVGRRHENPQLAQQFM